VSLLTDYGLEDGFVAACHGVMLQQLAADQRLLDITHLVPPGDLRRGSAVLAQTVPHLPDLSVHVAVVDPGVGTERRGVVLRSGSDRLLVGPDNGLLIDAAEALGGIDAAYEITNRALMLEPVSATFHGRDVFAPVAARLATGTDPAEVGPPIEPEGLVRLPEPVRRLVEDVDGPPAAEAEIVTVDRFGNVQTSLDAELLGYLRIDVGGRLRVRSAPQRDQLGELRLGRTFGDVPSGDPVAYLDSSGLFTLAVNGGSAAARLGLKAGDVLVVDRAEP
jgi:S-adenosylmethionine hydrolase